MIDIIAVSDIEKNLKNKDKKTYDLLIGCGDLSPGYMDYIANEFKPRFSILIHGNHDEKHFNNPYKDENEQFSKVYKGFFVLNHGIINAKKYIKKDLLIAGFSGALSYGNLPFHFSEKDVTKLKRELSIKMLLKRQKRIDIMVSHTPPLIKNTLEKYDRYHQPSEKMAEILYKYSPNLWLYGHLHRNYSFQQYDFLLKKDYIETYLINSEPVKFIKYDEINKKVISIKNKKEIKTTTVFFK
jgi:Icc-related predicted phosphoesterase